MLLVTRIRNYGTNGQVMTSGGPGQPWYGLLVVAVVEGGLNFRGDMDVTQPAPLNPQEGDFYLNNTNGNASPNIWYYRVHHSQCIRYIQ